MSCVDIYVVTWSVYMDLKNQGVRYIVNDRSMWGLLKLALTEVH